VKVIWGAHFVASRLAARSGEIRLPDSADFVPCIRSDAGAARGKCYLCSVSTHHQVIRRDADGSPHSEPPAARRTP
jgi:hypothetical protein